MIKRIFYSTFTSSYLSTAEGEFSGGACCCCCTDLDFATKSVAISYISSAS